MYLARSNPRGGGRIDNACGDTGHPLAVKQKMNDVRALEGSWWLLEHFGSSFWSILVAILIDFGGFCLISVDFDGFWWILIDFSRFWLVDFG